MKRKVLLPLLVVGVGSVSMAVPIESQAEGEECKVNQYYEDGVCKNCAPCATYNRQPSKEPRACGRTIEDCGPCLTGFEAEEWTQGRYSTVCSKVTGPESRTAPASPDGSLTNPDSVWFRNGVAIPVGVLGAVILSVVTLTLGVFYYKRRPPQPPGRHDEEAAKMLQDGPPPYEPQAPPYEATSRVDLVGPERFRDTIVVGERSNEAVTNAAPIEYPFDSDNFPRDNDDRFLHPPDMDDQDDRFSNSSAETEADEWAPTEEHVPQNNQPVPVSETRPISPLSQPGLRGHSPHPLDVGIDADRISSQETPRDECDPADDQLPQNNRPVPEDSAESRPISPQPWHGNDDSLNLHPPPGLGNYEGVHVRLSELRRSFNETVSSSLSGSLGDLPPRPSDTRCTTPGLPTYADEGEEPEPPRSFSFNHLPDAQAGGHSSLVVPVASTSHDSGFDDSNRRRNYSDAFEVLVFFRFDVKRRRND